MFYSVFFMICNVHIYWQVTFPCVDNGFPMILEFYVWTCSLYCYCCTFVLKIKAQWPRITISKSLQVKALKCFQNLEAILKLDHSNSKNRSSRSNLSSIGWRTQANCSHHLCPYIAFNLWRLNSLVQVTRIYVILPFYDFAFILFRITICTNSTCLLIMYSHIERLWTMVLAAANNIEAFALPNAAVQSSMTIHYCFSAEARVAQ